MKSVITHLRTLLVGLTCFLGNNAFSQSVLNPNDPIVVYNPAAPPTAPAWNTIGKWVKTNRLSWNTSSFKAYHYNGFSFRLKFPTTYNPTAVDGKKYPMIIFFHGLGERGTIYDNEFQLLHGGQQFRDKIDNGTFDGYVIALQTQNGFWGGPAYDAIKAIINYMVVNNKLDPFRVVDNGLSAGGTGTWEMSHINPTYIAATLPMSAASTEYYAPAIIEKLKFSPIWIFQGQLDGNPDPYTTKLVRDAYLNAGGNFKYTEYAGVGHGTWNNAWAEPGFYPFVLAAHSANPWPLTGRKEFCPGDAINITIGLTPGFDQYEWRKDGVLMSGATTNTLNVTGTAVTGNPALGAYSARVRRGTFWSDWSPAPVELKIKLATISPSISIVGLKSKVIPALDGSAGTPLSVPAGYATYLWQKEGITTTIGTSNTLTATTAGDYKVKVTEQFGCSSDFSAPFTIIDANGPNKPDGASNIIVSTVSKTALRLDWSQNPSPAYNETNFEVYQSEQAGGPYTLIAITPADASNYTSTGLKAKTKYYYKVRAVNNTGASTGVVEVNGTTDSDIQPPTAPGNLTITGTTRSSVALTWAASTDDVAVTRYDVYVNGNFSYYTTQTSFVVNNLQPRTVYNFHVRARDASNNLSVPSNQVTGQAIANGLPYKYFTFTGTRTVLPDFSTLVPVTSGIMSNVAITPRTQNDRFAFLWEGVITIPVTGTYFFRTNSNEGSRLWLGSLNGTTSPYSFSGAPVVNNDGIHNAQNVTSAALNLTAGIYPIAIAFFEQTGSESMTVSWRTPSSGTSYVTIPNSAFIETPVPAGTAPANPSNLSATAVSYKRINVSWTDNSNNETRFEIWRSTNATSGFNTVGSASSNATSFADTASLTPSTTYYYRVRAVGESGESQLVGTVNAITQALPAAPATPTNLLAAGISSSKINVTWDDVATETSYKLYRSANDNSNFILYKTLAANTVSFVDSSLFVNAVFFYKVMATNDGGNSVFSNEDSAKTLNTVPVLGVIANQFMRVGTTLNLNIIATDPDPETLTVTTTNLPAFANFTSTGNGTGTLSFNNSAALGTYPNITISVADQNGGNTSISFDLTVNDNDPPVITGSGNVSLNETQTAQVNIIATDANPADVLTWSFTGLPAFATPVINAGAVQIDLAPGYADNGTYNVTATVNDGNQGTAATSFVITVSDVDPNKKIFVNFNDGTLAQGAPWNNTNKTPVINDAFPALKDNTGTTTAVGLRVTSNWQDIPAPSNTGVNTGNNSGIYPDNVMRSFWFTNAANQILQINGLSPTGKYNVTFFGSRGGVSDDRTSLYTIGTTTVTLNAANNSQNTVSINNLTPNPDGTLTVTLAKGTLSQFGYLNAMVIDMLYDDGTTPAKPRNLTGSYNVNKIDLNWVDAAYNEKAYEVYRSTTGKFGAYTLLNPGGNNAGLQLYSDAGVSGNKTYHYYVVAKNDIGNSPSSDTIAVTTPNASPVIAAIANVAMKQDQSVNVNISATDDAGDVITLQVTGLPSFATFTPTGNGTGTIAINPGSTKGTFNGIIVTATDQSNASSSRQFNIVVTDKNITSYYVNFNSTIPVGAPWNSFNRAPTAGAAITNINDEAGAGSAIGVTVVDAWTDGNTLGGTTGNNSGVFPDNVMQTFYYTDQTTARRIRITGLPNGLNQKYNLVLFASRGGVADNRTTIYASGAQTVSLNAASNISNTVQLGGLIPDASGVIEFTAQKDPGAPFGYINAMVLQSYIDNGIPLAPQNLTGAGLNTTIQLNWSDRSNNEDGFEVHRSTSINGTYTLLTTTAANATSYTDANPQVGTLYYYKVRAVRSTNIFSAFSNVTAASTILYTIDLNFNDGSSNPAQGGNWNNTNTIIQSGFILSNLKNRMGQNTGMNFGLINNFTGYNVFGKTTGNNTGIYPDNVMAGFYYVVPGDTTRWKFDGLNMNGTYNFIFFGSRQSPTPGAVTTTYRIGNQIVTLDATDNTSRVARINGVKPDSTGTVYISMYTVAGYGYINAMTIEGALSADNNSQGGSGSGGRRRNNNVLVTESIPVTSNSTSSPNNRATSATILEVKASAYPNPFVDEVMLRFEMPQMKERIMITLVDQSGRMVYSRELRNVPQGISQFPLGIKGNTLSPGVYFLRAEGVDMNKQVLKLIKK